MSVTCFAEDYISWISSNMKDSQQGNSKKDCSLWHVHLREILHFDQAPSLPSVGDCDRFPLGFSPCV